MSAGSASVPAAPDDPQGTAHEPVARLVPAGGVVEASPPAQAASRRPWLPASVRIPLWLAVSRVVVGVLLAHLVISLLPQSRQHLPGGTLDAGTWLGAFDRWDSGFYLLIAAHGYPASVPALTAFFPGYPLVVRLVHALGAGLLSYVDAATLVSWAAFVGASMILYTLVARRFGGRVALVATALFAWYPASLFFLAPYSEALFALEIVGALALMERRRFFLAAAVAAAGSATSPESVALTVAIAVGALLVGRGLLRTAGYVVLSGVGLGAYVLYLWARFDKPFQLVSVQKLWHRSENPPFVGLYRNAVALEHYFVGAGPAAGGSSVTYANLRIVWILDDTMLFAAGVLLIWLVAAAILSRRARRARRVRRLPALRATALPATWLVFAAVIVLVAACTTIYPYGNTHFSSTESEARFVSLAVPLFAGAALLLRRWAGTTLAVVTASVMAAAFFQMLYNLGYWLT